MLTFLLPGIVRGSSQPSALPLPEISDRSGFVRQQRITVPTCRASKTNNRVAKSLRKEDSTFATYFATCAQGLGDVLAEELRSKHINADVLEVATSGVRFRGISEPEHITAYRACLWLRTATRVLHFLFSVSLPTSNRVATLDAVYDLVKQRVDWGHYLQGGRRTFSIQIRTSEDSDHPSFRLLQIRAKDAICDSLRDAHLEKPPPPENHGEADLPLVLVLHNGVLTLYRDMAGVSLHKRGYRADTALHRSSLNESVAAGMLYLAGFTPEGSVFIDDAPPDQLFVVDPMCGSATLLIEAALLRLQVAVGLYRQSPFPFEHWPEFSPKEFAAVRDEAVSAQISDKDACIRLLGTDIHKGAIRLAQTDVAATRLDSLIKLSHCDIRDARLSRSPTLVVSNPPWGKRLEDGDAWHEMGVFLREQAAGCRAAFLSGDASATRALRMKARNRYPLRTGNMSTRVLIYDVLPKLSEEKKIQRAALLSKTRFNKRLESES